MRPPGWLGLLFLLAAAALACLIGCAPLLDGALPRVQDTRDDAPPVCTHRLGLSASCWGCIAESSGDTYCDRLYLGPVIERRI